MKLKYILPLFLILIQINNSCLASKSTSKLLPEETIVVYLKGSPYTLHLIRAELLFPLEEYYQDPITGRYYQSKELAISFAHATTTPPVIKKTPSFHCSTPSNAQRASLSSFATNPVVSDMLRKNNSNGSFSDTSPSNNFRYPYT